jgi:phosphoglycerate dehydrogenase-like enzyme
MDYRIYSWGTDMKIVVTARNFNTLNSRCLMELDKTGHEVVDSEDDNLGSGMSEEELYERVKDADIVIAGLEPFTKHLLERLPNLKMISRRGIGYDSVDINTCKDKGIIVTRTVGTVEGAVAELVIAYIMYFARRVDYQNDLMQKGLWQRVQEPGAKTRILGLVGFGGIGKEIAKRATALGMRVFYYCRHPRKEDEFTYGVNYLPLNELLALSDYVSVNVPLTDETKGMFNEATFKKMKQGSIFINTARAGVMVEKDLKKMVVNGHILGAAVDVYESEPCVDSILKGCPSIILTPHTASYTQENQATMNEMAANNVRDFIHGKLSEVNIVV